MNAVLPEERTRFVFSINSVAVSLMLLIGGALSAMLLPHPIWRALVFFIAAACFARIIFYKGLGQINEALTFAGTALGVAVAIVNLFGSGALLALSCFIVAALSLTQPFRLRWAFPWLFVLFISWFSDLYWSFDLHSLSLSVSSLEHLVGVWRAEQQLPSPAISSWLTLCRWLVIVNIIGIASRDSGFQVAFFRGFRFSLTISCLVICYQYLYGIHTFSTGQNSYWSAINRFAGSFSDPNAFGIVGLLALGYFNQALPIKALFNPCNFYSLAKIFFLLLAILLSGSRTLVVGVALVFLASLPHRGRFLLAIIVSGIICLLLLAQISPERLDQSRGFVPESLVRVAKTLHPDSARQALFSRTAFARIGFEMWRDNPIFGVGLGRFSQYLPHYAKQASVEIGPWLDNANNFYLGVLAELGLFGSLSLLSVICSLRFEASSSLPSDMLRARLTLGVFLIILLFGPHLDFDEVAVLFAVLVARAGVVVKEGYSYSWLGRVVLLLGVLILPFRAVAPQGIGFAEVSAEGQFRWTARVARFPVVCDDKGGYTLDMRLPHPGIEHRPVTVEINWAERIKVFKIFDHHHHREQLECRPAIGLSGGQLSEMVTIKVSEAFVPARWPDSHDYRQLGAQIFSPVL